MHLSYIPLAPFIQYLPAWSRHVKSSQLPKDSQWKINHRCKTKMGIGGGGDSSESDLEAVLEVGLKAVRGISDNLCCFFMEGFKYEIESA